MKKKTVAMVLACTLVLGACGQASTQEPSTQTDTSTGSETEGTETFEGDDGLVQENAGSAIEKYASEIANANIDSSIYLNYAAGIEAGVYKWFASDDGTYYTLAFADENGEPVEGQESSINVGANNQEGGDFKGGNGGGPGGGPGMGGMMGFGDQGTVYQGVYMNANVTNMENQTMLVYAPAEYFLTDADGNVTGINHEGKVGNYTADTAPIVYLNECGGWRSSSPRSVDMDYIGQGMVYVTAGARSRDAVGEDGNHTGKAPTQMVDLKSGIIELRANDEIIPGDKGRIVSVGTSGGGQMSSILGASGDMSEYYEYMYESGVLGVQKNEDGSYSSAYPDSIYAAQLYCPIADIENADTAYAWWWVDLADKGGTYGDSFTAFDERLQELEADAFVEYLNGLGLKDSDGNKLELTGIRSGSYYDAILQNISDALNAMVDTGDLDPETEYPDSSAWLEKNDDGTWQVTDMAGLMVGTGLVNNRNKAIPGFDPMDKSAENDAFGTADQDSVHFSKSVARILSDNYEELSKLDGFNAEEVDDYIEEALSSSGAAGIERQADLLNATEIMLGTNGLKAVNPAQYWRDRSGTADQHTSFSVGYNICLAASMLGLDADYHLVWNMQHGNNEGESTGTFISWINEICKGTPENTVKSDSSTIDEVRFQSSITGTEQRMQVYKPAGYSESQKYPVLYLINGGFTDDTAWSGMGVQETIDSMVKRGDAPKMLIVMPDGNLNTPGSRENDTQRQEDSDKGEDNGSFEQGRDSKQDGTQNGWQGVMPDDEIDEIDPVKQAEANETRDKFINELTADIIPYIDSHYSVYTDRNNRAIAGFSYGGAEALYAGVSHFDLFSYIGVFSMGIMGGSDAGPRAIQGSGSSLTPEEFVNKYPEFFADADATNAMLNLFWIGVGKEDNIIAGGARLLSDTLKKYGINNEFHETDGGHTPENWISYFEEFAEKLFPVEKTFQTVLKMDTHLHVDVPMEDEDIPWDQDIDLRDAMEKAGMNAIGMAFAVDYVDLTYKGHAYKRFMNALDEMDRILESNNLERTLSYEQMVENFEKGEPIIIQEVEGGHFLEGDVSRLEEAYDRGLRVFDLFHDNDADPALGDVYTNEPEYGGLTDLGADAIRESERLGILVDLAHASDDTVRMALEVAEKPILISHTALKGSGDDGSPMAKMMQQRLIPAELAKEVADKGGVIGVWPHLANSPEEYAANIKAMVDTVGIDHVTIGTDSKITEEFNEWDDMPQRDEPEFKDGEGEDMPEISGGFGKKNPNAVNHVWDGEEDSFYHSVIRALVDEGFTEEEIGKITGGNFMRVFKEATSGN